MTNDYAYTTSPYIRPLVSPVQSLAMERDEYRRLAEKNAAEAWRHWERVRELEATVSWLQPAHFDALRDLGIAQARVAELEAALRRCQASQLETRRDLTPTHARITALEEALALARARQSQPRAPDLRRGDVPAGRTGRRVARPAGACAGVGEGSGHRPHCELLAEADLNRMTARVAELEGAIGAFGPELGRATLGLIAVLPPLPDDASASV